MAGHARAQGAEIVLLLVPSSDDAEVLIEQFGRARRLVKELGLPHVDVLDTFAYLAEVESVRISDADRHPNAAGHKLLFERIWTQLQANPEVLERLLGRKGQATADVATGGRSR
jgi:lysophospholipase L1-like esterase